MSPIMMLVQSMKKKRLLFCQVACLPVFDSLPSRESNPNVISNGFTSGSRSPKQGIGAWYNHIFQSRGIVETKAFHSFHHM